MQLTNNYNLPQSIFDAIANDPYDGPKGLDSISVTTLINSPKIRMLKIRHNEELSEDISDNIWRLLGSSVHSVLERVTDENRLIEERLEMTVLGKKISGKTDVYEAKDACIQDYKVTSAWSIVYSPDGKREWEEQLNCLAFLYRKAGFDVNSLRIVAILRDWSKTNALKDSSYPQIPIVVIPIPLWNLTTQTAYLLAQISEHSKYEFVEDDRIPECSSEERWASSDKYAVYKNSNKTATRVFDSETEAIEFISGNSIYRIEKRPGIDKRCTEYCSVNKFCHYWKSKYESSNQEMSEV